MKDVNGREIVVGDIVHCAPREGETLVYSFVECVGEVVVVDNGPRPSIIVSVVAGGREEYDVVGFEAVWTVPDRIEIVGDVSTDPNDIIVGGIVMTGMDKLCGRYTFDVAVGRVIEYDPETKVFWVEIIFFNPKNTDRRVKSERWPYLRSELAPLASRMW